MKKCPNCGSINQDSDLSCGVCGGSISQVESRDLESLEPKREPIIKAKTEVHPKGIALLTIGVGIIGIGAYLVFASQIIGLFVLLAGAILTAAVFGIEGSFTGTIGRSAASNEYRERRAKEYWDKMRENQEREVEE